MSLPRSGAIFSGLSEIAAAIANQLRRTGLTH
jgi:hypothetical protein